MAIQSTYIPNEYLLEKAQNCWQLLTANGFILAAANQTDNYQRVWARDCAVAALAITGGKKNQLYQPLINSLFVLAQNANEYGQIPSNVQIGKNGDVVTVSFGGPVGRTDTSFWWIIAVINLLKVHYNEQLAEIARTQINKIAILSNIWEVNNKHLMFVPASSNWADEYITNGYVLHDQLLRYWAFLVAGNYFNNPSLQTKALKIKQAIQHHFLLEEVEGIPTVFTHVLKKHIYKHPLNQQFTASFSPTDIVNRYDAWSIALILILNLGNSNTNQQLIIALKEVYNYFNKMGIPAFWPLIKPNEPDFDKLNLNHHYRFKNLPGHFHNGGIWPVVNGFICWALANTEHQQFGHELLQNLELRLQNNIEEYPFPEYFDAISGKPNGVSNLAYSVSGYEIALLGLNKSPELFQLLK
ncbi:MAG: glycoside hydrolase 100 family protein [Chitinophagaceae bacterium]